MASTRTGLLKKAKAVCQTEVLLGWTAARTVTCSSDAHCTMMSAKALVAVLNLTLAPQAAHDFDNGSDGVSYARGYANSSSGKKYQPGDEEDESCIEDSDKEHQEPVARLTA